MLTTSSLHHQSAAPLPALPPLAWLTSSAPGLGLILAISGVIATVSTYLVDTRVNREVMAVKLETAELKTRLDSIANEVDAKSAGLAREVDAKTAGLARELDSKTAGLADLVDSKTAGLADLVDSKTADLADLVDSKTAGLAREMEAKIAGVTAAAGVKAEAETLRLFKEFNVRVACCCW